MHTSVIAGINAYRLCTVIIPTNSKNDNLNVINGETLGIKPKKKKNRNTNKKYSVDSLTKMERTKLYSVEHYKIRLFKLCSEFTPGNRVIFVFTLRYDL